MKIENAALPLPYIQLFMGKNVKVLLREATAAIFNTLLESDSQPVKSSQFVIQSEIGKKIVIFTAGSWR